MSRYEFTKAHCDEWHDTPNRNPKTNRKINPKAEFGVFAELERQCHPKQKKKQKKENSNSPKSYVKTPKSPSPRVSPLKNNNSNNSNNSNSSPAGVRLIAQITIIRNPIIEMFRDVKTCMFDYCENAKNSEKLNKEIGMVFEMMTDKINKIQSPTDAPKAIKQIEKEIDKHKDLKKFADCVVNNCAPKYKVLLEKANRKMMSLAAINREKLQDKTIESRMTNVEKKGIEEAIDILSKRMENLMKGLEKGLENDKKSFSFPSTDIIFLLPLFSQAMGHIMMYLIRLSG